MKAAMLIDGVQSTYVFETALENLEKWFGDGRYSSNAMSPPIWVERSEDGNSALIIYNGGINNGKYPKMEIYDTDFFTESYSDSKINNIFSACMDPTNKPMMGENDGVYFINENSDVESIKNFSEKVKRFAARTIMNPASIIAMESRTEDTTMFKIIASAAAESENIALEAALESVRKYEKAMNGMEEYSDFDRDEFDEHVDILNSKPTVIEDPTTFEEPEGLGVTNDGDSVNPDDLDASDYSNVPLITEEDNDIGDLKPSDASISDSKPLDDKGVVKPVETPKNGLLEALMALQEKMGITEAEFISRLEKVLLIGKLAGGPQSAAVEEEKAPLAENAIPEENNIEEPAAITEGRGSEGDIHYTDTPDGIISNISGDELFGPDYGDDNDDEGKSEANSEFGEADRMDNNTGEEGSGSHDDIQEEPKEINEDLPADELIKELANESKSDDEFFDMLLKRKAKFGLPTLIKAANIDMRSFILTGVESAIEAEVKSKRVALI